MAEAKINLNVITITKERLREIIAEEVAKRPVIYPYRTYPDPYWYPYNPALPGITYSINTNKIVDSWL